MERTAVILIQLSILLRVFDGKNYKIISLDQLFV